MSNRARRLLEPYLIGTRPQPGGDWDARCPIHEDKKRSARINFDKNVWVCFAGCGKGSLAGLLKLMKEKHPESDKKPSSARPVGTVRSINPKLVTLWHEALMENEYAKEFLWHKRDISNQTMKRFRLGYNQASQAFTIPVYLEDGTLYNVRKYRPNAPSDQKIFWAVKKKPGSAVPMYPLSVLKDTSWVVITEGEMDAILANQYGFPAVSGTAGAKTWHVEWSELFKNKQVWIAYDRDATGESGAMMVAEHLEPYAAEIRIVRIPIKQKGADVTDFFWNGNDPEDFKRVLRRAKLYDKRSVDPMDTEPVDVSVIGSFDSKNIGRSQSMEVLVTGRSKDAYSLPHVVTSSCTMDAGARCSVCPMLAKKGNTTYSVKPSNQGILAMIGSNEAARDEALRKYIGAVKCNRLTHDVTKHQDVERLYVRPTWEENAGVDDVGDFTMRGITSVGKHDTKPSQIVHITGTTWPDPSRQMNEFLAWDVKETEDSIDEFKVTPETVRQLRHFRPEEDQSPLLKMGDVAMDLEQHVTRIYGRLDLHVAADLVFHSVLAFPLHGKIERRGWLDALVIGDTRTGKSEVAQRMLSHYRAGQFMSCESASFAGIVGGLQQMEGRQWSITWGIIPASDRRLVVLDEAGSLSHEAIAKMSDVRSRGLVKLQMIEAQQAPARTRLLWLSNPRDASMDKFTYGVQAIEPLIGNREDIARFDFAMALTGHDVETKQIHRRPSFRNPEYSSEDCYALVMWAWSRRPEDVEWDRGAEREVFRQAEMLGHEYVSDPPLLQKENAHVKVARISVAMAAATFSSDSTGQKLIVNEEHVKGAVTFLRHLYSKERFGYSRMSERQREIQRRAIGSMDEAKRFLEENLQLVTFLQSTEGGAFQRDMLETMANVMRQEANALVNRMFELGLVSPNGHKVKINAVLHQLLREIEKERS